MGKLMYKGVPYSATGEVEANPQGTPSDTLESIGINGTIYEIEGGGGGGNVEDVYVNGTSVLDTNKIAQVTSYRELTQAEYDALPDSKLTDGIMYCISDEGIVDGDKFAPVIYSLEEREVGTWTDGKPLYQKTVRTTVTLPSNQWTATDVVIPDSETLVSIPSAKVVNGLSIMGLIGYIDNETLTVLNLRNASYANEEVLITLQYTKSTDVPGSGQWTTSGVPTVHYSTNEQVIGTWIDGKPIYQKTFNNLSLHDVGDWTLLDDSVSYEQLVSSKAIYGIYPITSHDQVNQYNGRNASPRFCVKFDHKLYWYASGIDSNDWRQIITVQYTKTTD